jgi:hypothetical protein
VPTPFETRLHRSSHRRRISIRFVRVGDGADPAANRLLSTLDPFLAYLRLAADPGAKRPTGF